MSASREKSGLLRRRLATSLAALPMAQAIANEPRRVVVLSTTASQGPHSGADIGADIVQSRLAALGHAVGKEVVISVHRPTSDWRFEAVAEAVVRMRPAVIVTGTSANGIVLRRFTSTIPIVLVTSFDPVAAGIADSLARPGGNVTGLTSQGHELVGKSIELVREVLPSLTSVLGLRGPVLYPALSQLDAEFVLAINRFGLSEARVDVLDQDDGTRIRAAINRIRPGALFAFFHPTIAMQTGLIDTIAREARLPWFGFFRSHAVIGALATYGANTAALWERSADFVDRILKGGNPATMPIEQPTRFERVVNLRIARALGIAVPAGVLAIADDVIE